MKRNFSKRKQGFILIELSIALIVIGLLFAGISAGTALIQSSKERSTISQLESIKNAVNMFTLDYLLPPGGLQNTRDEHFDNSFDPATGVCSRSNGTNAGIINAVDGNGTSIIQGIHALEGKDYVVSSIAMCQLHASKHISMPTGSTLSTNNITPGQHSPQPKLAGQASILILTYDNDLHLVVGNANEPNSLDWDGLPGTVAGVINGKSLRGVDKKISTGEPATGNFIALKDVLTTTGGTYCDYSSKNRDCVAAFKITE